MKPEVHVSGRKESGLWTYRVSVDGVVKDEINSTVRWKATQIISVQEGYTESLTGYVLGGQE
jgi:hypothetical protein